ncbi:DoxX-like family protein [Methylobacterium sp. 17Sr1-1]|uniref:DoxX-like family protein n=1 Tax=Methylobacterium sp. 17Sr1-1 TaxID=2202826 RepID=UPI001FE1675D|nr:DoxX-like family protein [Methylobacterium sp. 17Sr1-1]
MRRLMPLAALAMIGGTLAYLAAGTVLAPDLWADPLGPYVKTLPAALLALVALALAAER